MVDDDTCGAVRALWGPADTQYLPQLLPQNLPMMGRLKSPLQPPYATVWSELHKRESAGTGVVVPTISAFPIHYWQDQRKVTITVRGIKSDVTLAMGLLGLIFNGDLGTPANPNTWIYPSTLQTNLTTRRSLPYLAQFVRWWPGDGGGNFLEQDKDTKAGQDIWLGKLIGIVWSTRADAANGSTTPPQQLAGGPVTFVGNTLKPPYNFA